MALFKSRNKQSNLFRKEPAYKQPQKSSGKTKRNIIIAAVIIIIAIAAYYVVFLGVNQQVVSAPATVNLTKSGTVFSINSQQYLISLSSISLSSAHAYIHISKLPIFVNPLLNVTLSLNNITKVNAGSTWADVGIQLESISSNSVTVQVSPLFASLQIAPDSQDIHVIQSTLYNSGQPYSTSIVSGGSTLTTTAGTSTTSVGSTSTTAPATNVTALDIHTALKNDPLYALMLNFSVLYANTVNCTPSLYNSTYARADNMVPNGGATYANVSPYVPYNLSIQTNNIGSGNYNVVFVTKTTDSYYNNKPAAAIGINVSKEEIINETVSSSGTFAGQTYSELVGDYNRATSIGGGCEVEV